MIRIRDFQRRLRKLESILPPMPSADECWIDGLLWFGIANYLGEPLQDEQPLVAFARALGYRNESELNSALISRAWEVRRKFFVASEKLFEKFDLELTTTPIEDGGRKIWETLKRMEAGLPKSYKDRLKTILARTDINLAWIQRQEDLASYFRCFA
jgi:hypothetical protein